GRAKVWRWAGRGAWRGRGAFGYNARQFSSVIVRVPTMSIEDTIRDQIQSHPILIYMKGNPNQPQCGFSARATQILMACGQKFAYVDILSNPDIRANLPKVSDWPTFPQLFVDGELVGGC